MEKKTYRCLVASPGDTSKEREICIKVFNEINSGIGEKFGFVVEKRMWEHNTRPSQGEYSQAVINKQLGYDYDIFIGILYKKYGTETKVAGSGTEEEFNNAYKRIENKENVEIMFYFNDEAAKMSQVNAADHIKINEFRKKIAGLGTYYWVYDGPNDFEQQIRKHLTNYFLDKHSLVNNKNSKDNIQFEILKSKFEDRLNNSLKAFNSQPIIWVEPMLSDTNQISHNPDDNYSKRIKVSDILENPESFVINAPPEFGLTSLAHFIVNEAWKNEDLWIYLNSNEKKAHNIHKSVQKEAEELGKNLQDVKGVILDSWDSSQTNSFKKLKNLSDSINNLPLIVMRTINDSKFLEDVGDVKINRDFKHLHLLALPRTQIRKVVSEYNKAREIDSEDKVLTKVVSDLEVLNIHRTPMNCLTLLKVAEKYFDESPINRTDMIEKVLFVLFNMDDIPSYKTKPDLKDCEFVLGKYCEKMIRNGEYHFSREEFIKDLGIFCEEKLIDLDINTVFDTLHINNIIIKDYSNFKFRSSYWIYYFAARRMHSNKEFSNYIFESKIYIAFPEIIEFYTGIDRNKEDALKILTRDIKETCDIVTSKIRLTQNKNPFELIKWQPTEQQIQHLQEDLSKNVSNSGLPENIKDQHADRNYNQIRPYNQSISSFFAEYSLHNLIQNVRASSRALRNSDYVEPEAKREILKEILRSWDQISKVLLALTPILADKGRADFEGHGFILNGDFGETFEIRVNRIIQVNMTNVVGFFKEDIYSSKLAPLLYEHLEFEKDLNKKHKIALLLIFTRPRNWKQPIEKYIIDKPKNSFYLYDVYNALQIKLDYDFISEKEKNDIAYLIKICFAKHELGSNKPSLKDLKNVQFKKNK